MWNKQHDIYFGDILNEVRQKRKENWSKDTEEEFAIYTLYFLKMLAGCDIDDLMSPDGDILDYFYARPKEDKRSRLKYKYQKITLDYTRRILEIMESSDTWKSEELKDQRKEFKILYSSYHSEGRPRTRTKSAQKKKREERFDEYKSLRDMYGIE